MTALITGAGSGIGEAIALQYARKGTDVVLAGLGQAQLEAVRDRCAALGVGAWAFETDLAQTASIDALTDYVRSLGISPDIFILNAGVSQRALTLDSDFSVDKKLMDINYFGSVYLVKRWKDHLRQAPVHIGVTTSISGLFGFPLRSAYCASKHALFGFFESLALENRNLKVTFLIPGRVRTQISKSALLADGTAYARMDPGQAGGIEVAKCARQAVRAIERGKHKKLLGGKELLMVYIYKYTPWLYYILASRISAI